MVEKNSVADWLPILFLLAAADVRAFGGKTPPPGDSGGETSSSEAIWITRPDGAQQCSPGSGQSLGDSAQQLKNAQVHVLNSQKGSDSKMHAQICGIPSGKTNTFQIPKDDLSKAAALGYHQIPNLMQ